MNKKRITLFLLVLILIFTSVGFGYHTYSKIQSEHVDLKSIKTFKTQPRVILSANGIQSPTESYTVYFNPLKGQINRILTKSNSKISAKSPILEYYNYEKEQEFKTLKDVLNQIPHTKNSPLPFKNQPYLASPLLYSQLLQLQNTIRTTQFSPINGKVTILNLNPSKSIDKIMQIDSDEKVIHANISESDLNLLKINQNFSISTSDKTQFVSKVKNIGTIPIKVKNHTSYYQIKLTTQSKYPIGTHFKVTLLSNDIEIPKNSLIDDKFVLITTHNKIIKREIHYTKSSKRGYIIVTSGLTVGENVVKSPSSKIKNSYNN